MDYLPKFKILFFLMIGQSKQQFFIWIQIASPFTIGEKGETLGQKTKG
jgi:hypothetical protein